MLNVKQLEALLEWARAKNAVIDFFFRETNYRLRIDKMFRAVDQSGNAVSWAKAFGTKKPWDILEAFTLDKIIIRLEGKEEVYPNVQALTRAISLKV
ncbi:MAG: hypothetical protein ACP5II_05485 [Infirmifilum sp.]|mgnify:CR=1 FL=1|jgi:hypothetical protein|uniref:Uncharacterized protein n=1 Tax=Infirmifilum uzonense TaxID=1550241 RepID=A0A0F7FJJ2_9CREN|nr:hypothetical protein [Infirmifilum uzonense]AKG39209.1 hypothetical protein MA03_08185 [Infirmifilum uzonense]